MTEKKVYKIIDYLHTHIIGFIIIVVACVFVISSLLILSGKITKGDDQSSNVSYQDMDTLYFPISQLVSIDPLKSTDDDIFYINQLMYSSLFVLDKTLNIENDLVSNYKTDPSVGSIDITLKSDVLFSDGTKLTADDVKYTVNQIKSIGSSSPYYNYISKIKNISVSGDTQLTVTFNSNADAAIDNLVFPIVSSATYSKTGDKSPVGSGPYSFSSYDSTTYLDLSPNKSYYGTIATNSIRFKVLPNVASATGLMTVDAITAFVNTSSDADSDAEDKGLKYKKINSNEAEYLSFNFANKYLKDKKIRVAIGKAIDTDSIVKDNYGGAAVSSDSIYFPGFLGIDNSGDAYPYNQSKAIKALNKAGFKDVDEDGVLEDKSGEKLILKLIVNSNNTSRVDAATSIAESLKNIGIHVNIEKLDWEAYSKALSEGAFDMALGGFKFDKQYDLRSLFTSGNAIGYSNEKVIKYVNALETTLSAEEQKDIFEKLKSELIDDAPYYCLCYKTYTFITADKFKGSSMPTYFDRYRGCTTWTWQRAVVADTESDK